MTQTTLTPTKWSGIILNWSTWSKSTAGVHLSKHWTGEAFTHKWKSTSLQLNYFMLPLASRANLNIQKNCWFNLIFNWQPAKVMKSNVLNCQTLTVRKKFIITKLRLSVMLNGKVLTADRQRAFSAGQWPISNTILSAR